jgi:hypothetical protein
VDVLKAVFYSIPAAVVIAAFGWFFVGVVAQQSVDFLPGLRLAYIAIVGLWLGYDLLVVVLRFLFGVYLSKRLKASFSDIMEAMTKHKIFKGTEFLEWTPEDFQEKMSIARDSEEFAKAIFDALFSRK